MNWLLIFTFSPVQSFISSAKKTKDLFAGSYLLSFLTKTVLTELEKQLKGNLIKVYPQVEESEKDYYSLTVGNYPNRFVVVLKDKTPEEVKEIMKTVKSSFRKELLTLASNTCNLFVEKALKDAERCPNKLENIPYLGKAVEQLTGHIGNYFSCFVVAKPVRLCKSEREKFEVKNYQKEYELTEKLLGGRKTFRPYEGKVDDTTYGGEKYPDGCTTCGERLHLAIDWQKARIEDVGEEEKLCGLCYAKRNLYEVYLKNKLQGGEDKELELLMTRFPSTHDIALAKEKFEFFKTLHEIYRNKEALQEFSKKAENITFFILDIAKVLKGFAPEGAKSYGINLFYRKELEKLVRQILPTENDLKNFLKEKQKAEEELENFNEDLKAPWAISVEYLSTNYIEGLLKELRNKTDKDKKKIQLLEHWLNTLRNYFGAVKEVTQKDFEKEFNKPPYFAIIYSDGDNIGRILGGEKEFLKENQNFSLEFHQNFSKRLSEYALETAKEIEKPSNRRVGFAKVIYAGGDDIFAFLHGSEVIRTLRVCSENYREKLKGLLKEEKATTSAGVVLGHAKVSLKYLHKKTKEAESRAKKVFRRNAFVIKVISRSGEESEFGAKYYYCGNEREISTLDLLEEIVKGYSDGSISSKLPYTLRDIADRFLSLAEGKEKQIAETLLKRELLRKINPNWKKKGEITQKVLDLFKFQLKEHKLGAKDTLKNVAGMFYIARRLSDYYRGLKDDRAI